MARGKKLTSFQCGKVTAYCESGMSLRKITNKIGKSTKCIQNFLRNPARYQNKNPTKTESSKDQIFCYVPSDFKIQ